MKNIHAKIGAPIALPGTEGPAKPQSPLRLVPLDGLRGLAALIVFAHHALALFYGPLAGINDNHWPVRPAIARIALQRAPLAWMFNGTFAVSFFFVLSGFVLTLAVGSTPTPARVARLMAYRLLRLFPLVLVATLMSYALFGLGVSGLNALRCLSGNDSTAYISPVLLGHHSFFQAIKQVTYEIWRGPRAEVLFDPPLWSIGVELQGSLLVYMLAALFGEASRRHAKYWVGVPVGLSLMGPSALCFLAGMYIAERSKDDGVILPVSRTSLLVLLAGALVWASVHPWDRHLWLPLPFNPPELLDAAVSAGCAVVLIAAALQLARFRQTLTTRPIKFLGHVSYGLYVVHVPLLYVASGPLLKSLRGALGYNAAVAVTASVVLACSLVLGRILVDYVDTPLSRRSKTWVSGWLEKRA